MIVAKISHNIGLKGHIIDVHERKDSIVINVAKILLEDVILKLCLKTVHEKDFEFNCDHCGKYINKLFMNHTKHWNEITAVYENKDFNCDQCGKYFARGCNLKVLKMFMIFIHELWTLWPIFHQSIQFAGNLSQNQNSEEQRHYDCESWGRSSTQLENLNKHIMGIHAGQRNYKCV